MRREKIKSSYIVEQLYGADEGTSHDQEYKAHEDASVVAIHTFDVHLHAESAGTPQVFLEAQMKCHYSPIYKPCCCSYVGSRCKKIFIMLSNICFMMIILIESFDVDVFMFPVS